MYHYIWHHLLQHVIEFNLNSKTNGTKLFPSLREWNCRRITLGSSRLRSRRKPDMSDSSISEVRYRILQWVVPSSFITWIPIETLSFHNSLIYMPQQHMYQVYHSSRKHIWYMQYIIHEIYIRLSLYIEKIYIYIYIVSGCIRLRLPEIELLRLQRRVIEKHTGWGSWVKLEDSWVSLVLKIVDAYLLLIII